MPGIVSLAESVPPERENPQVPQYFLDGSVLREPLAHLKMALPTIWKRVDRVKKQESKPRVKRSLVNRLTM